MAVVSNEKVEDRIRAVLEKIHLSQKLLYQDILPTMVSRSAVSILDIGCGDGYSMNCVDSKRKIDSRIGLDFERALLIQASRKGTHDLLIQSDMKYLPIRTRSVDVCLLLGVISYLKKEDALKLLSMAEQMAKKQVIVFTPLRALPPLRNEKRPAYENWKPFQHRSTWEVTDFTDRGYSIVGVDGIRGLRNRNGKIRFGGPLKLIGALLSYATQLFTYYEYNEAFEIICVKNIDLK